MSQTWRDVRYAVRMWRREPVFALTAIATQALGIAVTTAVAAVAYGVLAVSMNYRYIWEHVGNGQRGSFELFITLGLCLLAWRSYSPPLRYALGGFWIGAVWYTAFGAFDAAALRVAAHLPL